MMVMSNTQIVQKLPVWTWLKFLEVVLFTIVLNLLGEYVCVYMHTSMHTQTNTH